MVLKCCISSCQEVKSLDIQLHPFPTDPILRQKWLNAIKKKSFIPKRNHRICSKHFKKKSYVKKMSSFTLKDDAIPWFIHTQQDNDDQDESTSINNIERFIRSIVTEKWIVKKLCKLLKNVEDISEYSLRPLIQEVRSTLIGIQFYKNLLNDLKNGNIPNLD